MKHYSDFYPAIFAATLLAGSFMLCANAAKGQESLMQPSLTLPGAETPLAIAGSASDASDDSRYSEGTHAIQENRWADAESIFAEIAERHGNHAEGALYWKAFAENKQGKGEQALKTCAELRQSYAKSRWVDDCGALEIEIRGKSGQPVEPQSEHDENLKLLALNTLIHQNESKALPQIQEILTGDQPERFKEQALFVLAQSQSKQAQKMLAGVANPPANAPESIKSNVTLQRRAQQLMAAAHDSQSGFARVRMNHRIGLDMVVTDEAGNPVSGLNADSFTVLDNDRPQKIVSFHAGGDSTEAKPDPPTEILILIDTVNASLVDVSYERQQIAIFLRQNGGALANPVSIFFLNGNGAQRLAQPSRDGNALASALDKADTNLHPIRRSEAFYGAVERLQLSFSSLASVALEERLQPGRKILLWLSPGWPLLARTDSWSSDRQSKTLFEAIVSMSSALRESRVTLYSVDPARAAGIDSLEWFRYKDYLKPVINADRADVGHVSIQVLAQQSGGKVMNYSKDYLNEEIAHAVADADSYYYLSFDAAPASRVDEYHALGVTVNRPGLKIRTRSGYYDQP